MPHRLDASAAGFEEDFRAFLSLRDCSREDIAAAVAQIVARVREEGDAALLEYTRSFDHAIYSAAELRVSREEIAAAKGACAPGLLQAMELAAERIRRYHERQLPADERWTDETGATLGWRWTPVAAAGIYVPGGRAVYPSSTLMNAVPAKAAGVGRLVMTVPAPQGVLHPALLAAADLAGVDEIYRVGGAQAVAALAWGTESIAPVDVIAGPGNAYVAEAKRQAFGQVGIDMIAGPSEILVVADAKNNPEWIAADLLSQAEHAPDAQAILMTGDAGFAARVEESMAAMLAVLPRAAEALASWRNFGAIILVDSWTAAAPLIDRIAPEHLELAIDAPRELADRVRNAGAIFLGRHTPEPVGDYIAGPSHVLPTSRTARFSSVLSVTHFMKRTSLIECTPGALAALAPAAEIMAEAEGLHAHALAMRIRRR